MKKYEEENYKYENICDKIYPWVKTELTDSHALNGKHFSKKDAPVISFLGDLNVVFAIKRGEDAYEILKDNMLPPECDIIELYHKSCENLNRDVEFVVANTWYGGFGIVADGHHEASSVCFKHIWQVCADKLEDDLIIMIPRKGAEVADITEKSLRDVLEVRKALEELAVQLACEKITQEELEELEKAGENFKKVLNRSKDITEVAEADVRFHDVIYMATDNQKLILLLNNLREQMYRYRVEYLKREEAHPQLIAEHAEIIEYISKGEKKAATDVMCKHIDNQVTTVIDVIRTKQS